MSFPLPLEGSKARELMGDMVTVAMVLDPKNFAKMPTFLEARREARKMFEADKTGAMKRVSFICARADDERWLVSFGPRGGWRKEWNFGTGRN